ncbi:MAG: PhoH family protein [Candidatus Muiribacteriota bacterium]
MIKKYVLDTNILISDSDAIFNFEDNEVIIPLIVLEELDRLKSTQGSAGANARKVLKNLDRLREKGNLIKGVEVGTGGLLRIDTENTEMHKEIPATLDRNSPDNYIISVAFALSKETTQPLILVSNDINVRVKSSSIGIKAEAYESNKVNFLDVFKGFKIINVEKTILDIFYKEKELQLPDFDFTPNECVLLKVEKTGQSALAKFCCEKEKLIPLYHISAKPWGIDARNLEQRFAIELLMSSQIECVCLIGTAGTGKTLLALAAGLEKVLGEKVYKRLIVSRPVIPMGKDIGYLPGSKDDKMGSWMQPITDNLDFLFGADIKKEYNYLYENKLIQVEALTYIRGRSLPDSYIIIDEAQNLTSHEVKTIITRAGANTKIVLTGDPFQIDIPYLDESNNGLSYIAEKFKNEGIAGRIVLNKGERSSLATRGAELL